MKILICCLVAVIIYLLYYVVKSEKRFVQKVEIDKEIEQQNRTNQLLLEQSRSELNSIQEQIDSAKNELTYNIDKNQTIVESIENQQKNADKTAKQYFASCMAEIDYKTEKEREKSNQAIANFWVEYQKVVTEAAASYEESILDKKDTISLLDEKIADLQSIVDAAVEAKKRESEKNNQKDFYRMNLSAEDILEIKKLRSVIQYLRNPEALNKVIWKVYYEKPCAALIGRVVGSVIKTGIYKITNLENGMCYVGQSANIADRWKQHIKRGIGAELTTKNKLYPAMQEFGVENFTFEIIEECERDQLDKKEDYWQEYFHAKDFGYSIK